MSDIENGSVSASHTPEMDYDMWEGQFEFLGPSAETIIQPPQGLLKPVPHLPATMNGIRKNPAHVWCDEITDQVILINFDFLFIILRNIQLFFSC